MRMLVSRRDAGDTNETPLAGNGGNGVPGATDALTLAAAAEAASWTRDGDHSMRFAMAFASGWRETRAPRDDMDDVGVPESEPVPVRER